MSQEVNNDEKKTNALREIRKLLSILGSWGNVLVPNLPDKGATTAAERLEHFINLLKNDYGMSVEDIEKNIQELN